MVFFSTSSVSHLTGPRRVADKQAAEEVVSKKLKAAASAALAIDGPLAADGVREKW